MTIDTHTLIWMFPVVFMLHDFEEIILGELWTTQHAEDVRRRFPAALRGRVDGILGKSTAQLALPIAIIFCFIAASAFVATELDRYGLFIFWSTAIFAHAFIHIGQAVLLRSYVPAVITSAGIVLPYGLVLFSRLMHEGILDLRSLLLYMILGAVLFLPFLLVIHRLGDVLFERVVKCLV